MTNYPRLFNKSYAELRRKIVLTGMTASPRGQATKELIAEDTWFYAGEIVGRDKLNPALGFMEGLQLVAGVGSAENIRRVAPGANFDLFTPMSFYGPRVRTQVPRVLDELRSDPLSRRAVLVVASPTEEPVGMPCTLAIQFLIRGGRLATIAHMRSSDSVFGVPYDVMQFGMLTQAMAHVLGVVPYSVALSVGSQHTYSATAHLEPTKSSTYFHLDGRRLPRTWASVVAWAQVQIDEANKWKGGVPGSVTIFDEPMTYG